MAGIINPSGLKQEDFPNSRGEWMVYQALSRIVQDQEWIVLYDVWQEKHVTQSHGQHDFIVMIPEKGIIVIEVKGSIIRIGSNGRLESLNRGRNEWVYIGEPFSQAKDNSYSLIKDIEYTVKNLRKRPLITWGVMFPEMREWRESIEWPSFRLYLNKNEDGRIGTVELIRFLYGLTEKEIGAVTSAPNNQIKFDRFSFEEYKLMASIIRPMDKEEFRMANMPQGRDQDFEQLSIETLGGLDHLNGLDSIYFYGGAGTGKTWLCSRMLKRTLAEEKKCIVITHSELLKEWIKITLGKAYDCQCLFLSMHEHLKDEKIDSNMFIELRSFLNDNTNISFFIDEAQDVVPFINIDEFERELSVELSTFKWRLFGDPEKQAKWNDTEFSIQEFIDKLGIVTVSIPLKMNLRNSLKVFERLKKVVLDPVTTIEPNNILGEEPYKVAYQNEEELFEKLDNRIEKLISEGVSMHRISVISLGKDLKNKYLSSSHLGEKISDILEKGTFVEMSKVTVAEVHEFKGLENDHILLIGLTTNMKEVSKELYVAISRAKLGLSLFIPMSNLQQFMTIL